MEKYGNLPKYFSLWRPQKGVYNFRCIHFEQRWPFSGVRVSSCIQSQRSEGDDLLPEKLFPVSLFTKIGPKCSKERHTYLLFAFYFKFSFPFSTLLSFAEHVEVNVLFSFSPLPRSLCSLRVGLMKEIIMIIRKKGRCSNYQLQLSLHFLVKYMIIVAQSKQARLFCKDRVPCLMIFATVGITRPL